MGSRAGGVVFVGVDGWLLLMTRSVSVLNKVSSFTPFKRSTSPPSPPSFYVLFVLFGVIRIMFGAARWVGWGISFVSNFFGLVHLLFVSAAYSARFVPFCSVPVSHFIFLRLLGAISHRTRVLYRA
jgi:hypothetical protein